MNYLQLSFYIIHHREVWNAEKQYFMKYALALYQNMENAGILILAVSIEPPEDVFQLIDVILLNYPHLRML